MDEKESSREKLIEKFNIQNKLPNNLKSSQQILEKSIEEKIFCCCLDYDLTISEYKSYNDLKKKVIPSYDKNNPIHENALHQLFSKTKKIINKDKESSDFISNITNITTSSINSSNNNININIKDEDSIIWRKIGFQTGNPRTDFRAGGIFSLDVMNYFVNNHEKEYINMINEEYFTFALVCIRLSHLIRIYLYLLYSEDIKISLKYQKNILASRKELKIFCYFLYDNNNLLFDIISVGLKFIYQKFLEQKKNVNKEINYLIIDPIIVSSIQCLKNSLNNANIQDNDIISQLKERYREFFLKNLK